ncbi:hypothetical protein [Spirilliplanes yamanashiensis]|uniref:Uncharacterized protein n=1 Tax=Spirilliplanes yamanashiensis TaxID=42233 RepID=A0A8J4DL51_9ACTN|nr:hypothetical protein [Spirilliplanes yamanashiensis]MDP9818197.1 hypothetical protein [Spirilliplanes yamanashiensis]GIJ05008.1 hypothetical protein Sya03_43600 [Spirilliplanes yamanashiensis]
MLSFARTAEDRDAFQRRAQDLAGLVIARVGYATIDYERHERAPGHRGPRRIVGEAEWTRPPWRHDAFDAVDYGAGDPIHVVLGDADPAGTTLRYSADTVAVVFPPDEPPGWARPGAAPGR